MAADFWHGGIEDLDPREADREAEYWVTVGRAEHYANHIGEQAYLAALESDEELDAARESDRTPDGTSPIDRYQAPGAFPGYVGGQR